MVPIMSQFSSPVWPLQKPDRSWWITVDYHRQYPQLQLLCKYGIFLRADYHGFKYVVCSQWHEKCIIFPSLSEMRTIRNFLLHRMGKVLMYSVASQLTLQTRVPYDQLREEEAKLCSEMVELNIWTNSKLDSCHITTFSHHLGGGHSWQW